jgi:hypothetical protein
LVKQYGEVEIVKRAKTVPNKCSIEDVFSILTTRKRPLRNVVRVSIARGQKYLRIDVPNFAQIAPHVKMLEEILNVLLATGGKQAPN